MDPTAILQRVLDEPRVARVRAVLDTYGHAAGGLLANGLAFSALFAAIPTVLLILGLAGWIANDPGARERFSEAIIAAFPPLEQLVESALDAVSQGAAVASILGVIGLVWTVSQLYGALDVAFARIFADVPERDIIRRTLRGFLVVGLMVVIIVVLVVAGALATAFDSATELQIPLAGAIASVGLSIPVMIAFAIVSVALVYRTLPPRAPAWSSVLVPAVLVGAAIIVLTQVFAFLVPRLVGVAALAGSLAAAFIALAWLSFSFQALLYGAAWVRIRDEGVPAPVASTDESAVLGAPAPPAEPGGGGE